jgi:hypothetical protein
MFTSYLEQDRYFAWVMMAFASILFFVLFPLFLVVGLISLLAVFANRGPRFIAWRAPKDCVTLLSWLAFEWDYEGLGGRQYGMRVLGFDIAYNGVLR